MRIFEKLPKLDFKLFAVIYKIWGFFTTWKTLNKLQNSAELQYIYVMAHWSSSSLYHRLCSSMHPTSVFEEISNFLHHFLVKMSSDKILSKVESQTVNFSIFSCNNFVFKFPRSMGDFLWKRRSVILIYHNKRKIHFDFILVDVQMKLCLLSY